MEWMSTSKRLIRIRAVLTIFLVVLTIGTGLTMGTINFVLESKQSQAEGNKLLSLVTEDINDLTQFLLTGVRNRTTAIGKMADKGFLDLSNKIMLGKFGIEVLKSDPHISSIEIIEHATGNMTHAGRDEKDNLYILNVKKSGTTGKFEMYRIEAEDILQLTPKLASSDTKDPRQYEYYLNAENQNAPEWTEIRAPSPRKVNSFQKTFNYVYPIHRDGKLAGTVSTELGLNVISNFIQTNSEKIGFGGTAFAIERKSDGTLIVIGHEAKTKSSDNPMGLTYAWESSDPRIRVFEQVVKKYESFGLDPMNSTETLVDQIMGEDGKIWNMAWSSIFPNEKPEWVIVAVARKDLLLVEAWHRIFTHIYIVIFVLFFGGVAVYFMAKRASGPLEALSRDVIRIGRGEINQNQRPDFRIFELDYLARGIEEMKTGLLSFRKYIPSEVVGQVIQSRKTADLFVEKKNITVFFSDLRDFTNLSESMDPDALIKILGEHLAICTKIIQKHNGTIDKFIGDSVMAFWNAPSTVEDHPLKACIAALECQAAMKSFNDANAAMGLPRLFMRIGIHTGEALVGNIGSDTRLNYTAVGDTVNLASRLEGANKDYGTAILISKNTQSPIEGKILTRLVDKVAVKGKTKPYEIYEVMAISEDATPDLRNIIEWTNQGRALFEARKFHQAKDCYMQVINNNPEDGVAKVYLERCDFFISNPPPNDWDSAIHKTTK